MKKFKFRLEPILTVKSHIEKERQKEHSVAVEKVMCQKDSLTQLDSERMNTLESQRSRQLGRISMAEMLICSRYLLKLKRDTLASVELLRGLQREADVKHESLLRASVEKKIYEKLKEKQKAKYFQDMERLERKETDEIATNSHRRRKRSR